MLRPLLACLALACCATAAIAAPTLAITGVRIVDVERGHATPPRTVVVAGGRIVAIDAPPRAHVPDGATVVDGRGRFLAPGLTDMHVHLFNNASKRAPNDWAFPLFVAHGVTAVREMGARPGDLAQVQAWNRARADGTLLAPRIVAAAVVVRGESTADAARQVDAAADAGAREIKVFSDLPAAQLPAILAAAQARSLRVVGHVPARVSLREASGLRTAEHLLQVFEACSTQEDAVITARRDLDDAALADLQLAQESEVLATFSAARCRHAARTVARAGQAHVPTLVLDAMPRNGRHAENPLWPKLRADEQTRWTRILAAITPHDREMELARLHAAPRLVAALHRAGATLLAGTDTPQPEVYPGDSLHEELRLLVAAGLSPAQALRAATLDPARYLDEADDSGSVAVGKRADLLLLAADPTTDIANTRRIEAVVLDGRLLPRADLDALLLGP